MAIKKLSEFEDNNAIVVTGKLLKPISRIAQNPDVSATKSSNILEFLSVAMENNAADIKEMLAILSETPADEYHCTAASVMADAVIMFSDTELLKLFGFQS